jgi:hypothetical protein
MLLHQKINNENNSNFNLILPLGEFSLLPRVKWLVGISVSVILLGSLESTACGQCGEVSMRPRRALPSGIITTRMSSKDMQRWHAIKRIVFAEDARGQPIHPILRDLWEKIENSGHAVYIEMRSPSFRISTTAGSFRIERFDPQGIRHVSVIMLNPATIDQSYVGPNSDRPNGFIPFLGLSKEERYAEVLGHELAHAVYILSDLARTRMVEESIHQTNRLFLLQIREYGFRSIKPEMRHRIFRRDMLLQELEEQAEAVEELVWRELISGKLPECMNRKLEAFMTCVGY